MKETKTNNNILTNENIVALVTETALNSYGVVSLKDQSTTKKGKTEEGVVVRRKSDKSFAIDVYLVLAQGIKITEALRECQKSIKFVLDKKVGNLCHEVNVYAIGVSSN